MAKVFEGPYFAGGKYENKFCLGSCRVLLFISFTLLFQPCACDDAHSASGRIFSCLEFWESENKTFAYKLPAVLSSLAVGFSAPFLAIKGHITCIDSFHF